MNAPSDRLMSRFVPGKDASTLVVVFSQVRVPAGKFGLERLFAGTRHASLFFNDPAGRWYLGLEDEIDRAIDDTLEKAAPGRIIYYGSSMGAYGALRTGLRRSDGEIHAFGAELTLGWPGGQSPAELAVPEGHPIPALEALVTTSLPLENCHFYYGVLDPVDARQIADLRVTAAWSSRIHTLRSSHASHDHLYSLNIIRKIISGFSRDPSVLCSERDLVAGETDGELRQFANLHEAVILGKPVDPAEILEIGRCRRNPGMLQRAAEAVLQQKRAGEAAALLAEADAMTSTDPVLVTVPKRWRKLLPLRRAEVLAITGDVQGARAALEDCQARFPMDDRMTALAERLSG